MKLTIVFFLILNKFNPSDLRAKLEISINKVLETDKECELRNHAVDTDSDDDDDVTNCFLLSC